MGSFIKNLTFDCVDALRMARFWAAALGSDVDEESTAERAYVEAPAWGGPNIWFRGGRDPKAAPNRLHLDLRALTGMDAEVERLVRLGARVVLAGACYAVNTLALVLSPALRLVPAILLPSFVGELSLALWLLVKGVRPTAAGTRLPRPAGSQAS